MRLTFDGLFIKVSGLTTEEDALLAVALGANAVGFEFGPTPRRVSPPTVHDIVRRLPPGVVSVGVFRHEMPQRIVATANSLGLSAVQLDGPMTGDEVRYVSDRVATVLRATDVDVEDVQDVDYLVVPETDDAASLDRAGALLATPTRRPVIVSGGLDPDNVADVVRRFPVWGVDVRAGVESSLGVTDPVRLGAFVTNARWGYEHALVERLDLE